VYKHQFGLTQPSQYSIPVNSDWKHHSLAQNAASLSALSEPPNTQTRSTQSIAIMKLSKALIELRLRDSCRDNCINWRGAALRSEDHVQYTVKNDKKVLVGQIIDIQEQHDIKPSERSLISRSGKCSRTRMVFIRMRSRRKGRSVRQPDPVEYSHVSDCMKEVIDTDDVEWIPTLSIVGPCFIFHINHIQKGLVGCKGMDKVYFVRFRKSRNGKLILLLPKDWNSFYRDDRYPYEDSYPERI
jgi:hypothetical protein